ncbi:hypothetical protein AMECASPLE_039159 [Ameca splendens]|uniref:Uncharacterized protein n=1 Tax=Ameca splendens TaxID=208324 RepID=A0ABV1AGA9_9TELE
MENGIKPTCEPLILQRSPPCEVSVHYSRNWLGRSFPRALIKHTSCNVRGEMPAELHCYLFGSQKRGCPNNMKSSSTVYCKTCHTMMFIQNLHASLLAWVMYRNILTPNIVCAFISKKFSFGLL